MKLIVFGASGKTGQHVLEQALLEGHQVTAFVRNPERITYVNPNLAIVVGQATKASDVESALAGHDAVLVCLGGPGTKKSTVIADMTANIVAGMQANHITRIVQIATAGIHHELHGVSGFVVETLLKNTLEDHRNAVAKIETSKLDYTIVRPMSLSEGELTKTYRSASEGVPHNGRKISRADVADFMIRCLSDPTTIHQSIALAY
ncbi:MAG: NAD(P)-dependent oxidoreductase [Erysipelotrichaceae bacterium]